MVAAFQETKEFKVGDRVSFGSASNTGTITSINGENALVKFDHGSSVEVGLRRLDESDAPLPLQVGDRIRHLKTVRAGKGGNPKQVEMLGTIEQIEAGKATVCWDKPSLGKTGTLKLELLTLVERKQVEAEPALTRKPQEGDWIEGLSPTGTVYQGLVEGYSMSGMFRIRTADNKRSLIDTTTAKLIDPPGSETVSEVIEELPILEAIASVEGDLQNAPEVAETTALAVTEGDSQIEQLFAEINTLEAQGLEAEQTAIAAGRAALEIRREQGRKLQEAKDQVVATEGYGSWGKRFAEACPNIHIRTATNYMRLHREWEQIASQAGERLTELTLREAIALLQNKPALQAAPEPGSGPTFEELQQRFAPWGEFARTSDPKFKYSLDLPLPQKRYSFRSLKEADLFHQENCFDWNTIAARQQQQQLNQARTCVSCKHRQLIGDGSEFRCNARGSEHGVTMNLAPECRHYKSRMMDIPGRVEAIAPTAQPDPSITLDSPGEGDAIAQPASETVSEVEFLEAGLDDFAESMAPKPQPHSAGILASSARNAKQAKTEDEIAAELEKDERYSPGYLWQAALAVAGVDIFDLDPATNDRTNPHVPCRIAYTKEQDGLQQDWSCEVLWSNFPYSQIAPFVDKYVLAWENERFVHGFTLVKSDNSTRWYQKLLRSMTAVCLIDHRLTHEAPGRELNTSFFASALFYHGPSLDEFIERYDGVYGTVLTRVNDSASGLLLPEGRDGLSALAQAISFQEQRYAELVDEHLQVGDRILLRGDVSKSPWEVIDRDGDDITLIGPFMRGSETLLRSRSNPAQCDISEVRRIVGGGQ